MAVQAPHPYGLALASYLEAFDRAQQLAQAQQSGQLRQATMLQDLVEGQRKHQEEQQVMQDLTSEITARRGAPTLQPAPQIVPGQSPVEGGPDVGPGLPGIPPRSMAPMIPSTPPYVPFGASLPPERQAAVLASPRARPVIQSIEDQEKQAERHRLEEEARQLFEVGQERLKARDASGGYMELAKAYTRLGRHHEAGQWHERAIKLLDDKEERERSDKDWEKFLKAESAYEADPSFSNHLHVMEAMSTPESATFRAARVDLLKNKMKSATGQDWRLDLLKKKVGEAFSQAWAEGKEADLGAVLKGIQTQYPDLLVPVLATTLEKGGKLHDVVATKLLRIEEDVDPAKMKDDMQAAFQVFRAKYKRGPTQSLNDLNELLKIRSDITRQRKEAEQTPAQRELQALNLEMKRKQASGTLTAKDASLMVQRWDTVARNAETPEDAEIARSEMRFWMEHAGTIAKGMGGKIQERKVPMAQQVLKGRKLRDLAPEEKQAVIHAEAKRLFPAKVVEYGDIAKLSQREKDALFKAVNALESQTPAPEPSRAP